MLHPCRRCGEMRIFVSFRKIFIERCPNSGFWIVIICERVKGCSSGRHRDSAFVRGFSGYVLNSWQAPFLVL